MPSIVPAPRVSSPDVGDGVTPPESEPPIGLSIDVVHEAGAWPVAEVRAAAEAAAAAVGRELDIAASEACLALSSDAQVAQLNATYRGKASPTNVLSFRSGAASADGSHAASAQGAHLGDLVLAAETVSREAGELGLPLQHHVQHLVVHGLLHLLGYDHQTDAEAETMEALEVRILASLGVNNPYEAGEALPFTRRHSTEDLQS